MKSLLFLISAIFLINACAADDGAVTAKKCEDYLGQQTCDNLRKLASLLKEKASIVQDAVTDAVNHHKTKATEMLAYIKAYMAERIQCEQILNEAACAKLTDLGKRVHLTALQVKLAIEVAVQNGAKTVTDIYNKAVGFMQTEINCENIFGKQACDNIKEAMKKFGEQTSLLKEAIMTAAQKHITNVVEMTKFVKNYLVDKIVNFKCEKVLPVERCDSIRDIAAALHLKSIEVRRAIEEAVINGYLNTKQLYNKTLDFLTNDINCANILGQTACDNLVESAKKLKEQTVLIKEAIMAAAKKHINKTAEIIKLVKNTIVEKAVNFKCTDVLSDFRCQQLIRIASHFKIKASELHRVLVEAVINGTVSAKQIYDKTIGGLLEDVKNLKCEDLIPADKCQILDNLATAIGLKMSEVTMAVKEAIINGKDKLIDIITAAREYLKDKLSCDKVLGSSLCDWIERMTKNIPGGFKKVIDRLREAYANGKQSVIELYRTVKQAIKDLFAGNLRKRSITSQFKDKVLAMILKYVDQAVTAGQSAKLLIKEKVKKMFEEGKITLKNFINKIKELVATGASDEEITVERRAVVDNLKEKLKNISAEVRQWIEKLLEKSKIGLDKLKELLKSMKTGFTEEDIDSAKDAMFNVAQLAADEELANAALQIENLKF